MRTLTTSSIFKSQEAELRCAGSCWHELLEPSRPSKAQKRSFCWETGTGDGGGRILPLFWLVLFSCPLHLLTGYWVTSASLAWLQPQSWWLHSEFVVLPLSCQPLQFLSPSIAACCHWANSRVWSSTYWQICLCYWVRMTYSWRKLLFWNVFFLSFLLFSSKAASFFVLSVRILNQNRKMVCLIQDLLS